jgi:hypothetical protein
VIAHGDTTPNSPVVKVHTRAFKQDGTPVAELERTVLIPRRETQQ